VSVHLDGGRKFVSAARPEIEFISALLLFACPHATLTSLSLLLVGIYIHERAD
jgi:hypothetical protein